MWLEVIHSYSTQPLESKIGFFLTEYLGNEKCSLILEHELPKLYIVLYLFFNENLGCPTKNYENDFLEVCKNLIGVSDFYEKSSKILSKIITYILCFQKHFWVQRSSFYVGKNHLQ